MPPSTQLEVTRKRINDAAMRAAKPREKPYRIAVGGGLYLEVMPSGSKLWRWKYRMAGKENRFAIGAYPDVLLKQARDERNEALNLVKAGIHPAHHKRLEKIRKKTEHANSFEAVAREWLAKQEWAKSTHTIRERALEQNVFPAIGALPIRQVTPAHVLDILKRLEKRAPEMAKITRQLISAVCRFAVSTLRADADPAEPLRGALKPRKTEHNRPLTAEELPKFVRALDAMPGYPTTRYALQLMLLTLARSGEVLGAQWSEIDLEQAVWIVPAERMKKREKHDIPLPTQAVDLLRRLHALTGHREHLFPNRDDATRHASRSVLRSAIYGLGFKGFSPHGIRSTGSTRLNEMGYRADLIEKQLAHEQRNQSRRAYDRSTLIEERRQMMSGWASYLDLLAAGSEKVVPLRQQAA